MKTSPLALFLATGLIFGASAAAAAGVTHSSTAISALDECGVDGDQQGDFVDTACDSDDSDASDAENSQTGQSMDPQAVNESGEMQTGGSEMQGDNDDNNDEND